MYSTQKQQAVKRIRHGMNRMFNCLLHSVPAIVKEAGPACGLSLANMGYNVVLQCSNCLVIQGPDSQNSYAGLIKRT